MSFLKENWLSLCNTVILLCLIFYIGQLSQRVSNLKVKTGNVPEEIEKKNQQSQRKMGRESAKNVNSSNESEFAGKKRLSINDPQRIQKLNNTKKKIFLIKIRLNKYYDANKEYPQTVAEFKQAMANEIPINDITNSSRVSLDKDGKGGWFYNSRRGIVDTND